MSAFGAIADYSTISQQTVDATHKERSPSRGINTELSMKRVAVFGNAGGGKSTISRRLAELTGLPLYVVDMMQFGAGGVRVPQHDFLQAHADLLRRDEWIIDGFGSAALSWERFAVPTRWSTSICPF